MGKTRESKPATLPYIRVQFPNCYYGHFRAKSRADLSNYFRQLARPEPPRKFLDRQHVRMNLVFSTRSKAHMYICLMAGRSVGASVLSAR